MEFTVDELVACVKREVAYRKKVYPRLVESGGMSERDKERQIGMMVAIMEKLEAELQPRLL